MSIPQWEIADNTSSTLLYVNPSVGNSRQYFFNLALCQSLSGKQQTILLQPCFMSIPQWETADNTSSTLLYVNPSMGNSRQYFFNLSGKQQTSLSTSSTLLYVNPSNQINKQICSVFLVQIKI